MKTYLTLSAIALAAAATLSSGTALAQAPAPAPDFTITGNFGITSDYRFRGLQQTDGDPAFQGGFDIAHSSGLYIGTWGSNVSSWAAGPATSTKLEIDLYGGYKTSVADVGVDVGVLQDAEQPRLGQEVLVLVCDPAVDGVVEVKVRALCEVVAPLHSTLKSLRHPQDPHGGEAQSAIKQDDHEGVEARPQQERETHVDCAVLGEGGRAPRRAIPGS